MVTHKTSPSLYLLPHYFFETTFQNYVDLALLFLKYLNLCFQFEKLFSDLF